MSACMHASTTHEHTHVEYSQPMLVPSGVTVTAPTTSASCVLPVVCTLKSAAVRPVACASSDDGFAESRKVVVTDSVREVPSKLDSRCGTGGRKCSVWVLEPLVRGEMPGEAKGMWAVMEADPNAPVAVGTNVAVTVAL